jgi:hypothetical protein
VNTVKGSLKRVNTVKGSLKRVNTVWEFYYTVKNG